MAKWKYDEKTKTRLQNFAYKTEQHEPDIKSRGGMMQALLGWYKDPASQVTWKVKIWRYVVFVDATINIFRVL